MIRKGFLVAVFFLAVACGGGGETDWLQCDRTGESADGYIVYCEAPAGKTGREALRIDLKTMNVGQVKPGSMPVPRIRDSAFPYSFRIEKDFFLITPAGGEAVRHYILDVPAKAAVKSGLPVSRFHGKRGHFMRIQGVYAGGIVVREPKRLHKGSGFADAYFSISPEGTVGAEIPLPANTDSVTNHRVLFLSSRGVLIAACRGGREIRGISARTGKTLFRYP